MSPERREVFALRHERYGPDLLEGLGIVYGAQRAPAIAERLVGLAAAAYRDRSPELHRLDLARSLQPDWLQQPRMVGYAAYADRFAGGVADVAGRVDHLTELGVTYLHLMPVLRPREGDNDGGYAVADYRSLDPALGTIDDLRDLATSLRARGISLVLDLVLNHVAREHDWARRARAGEAAYRDYFLTYPDRTEPDAFERTLPEVFPDFAPGSFTFDDDLDAWVWTTFNSWQWDLNWANPEVLCELADVVLFLANLGVEVLRLDAIAFLWKRLGTNCQNQPEVHALTQVLRAVARMACPAVAFKAEAIVAPQDLIPYLGAGRHSGKVSDLAYHNSLMVQVWSSLATGDATLARRALSSLPPAPTTATWITYARCHDDIGWAIDDGDAAAVGLDGWSHRSFLSDWYVGEFPGSSARGLVFQANPATGDRRISGTTASLTGVEAAAASGEPAGLALALARHRLVHAICFGWGGVPVVWSGDELAQPNDPDWASEPGHEDDNRWAHRPRLSTTAWAARHDPATVPGRAFTDLALLAAVRGRLPHLHASVSSEVVPVDDPGLLVTVRRHPLGPLVCVYNLTEHERSLPLHVVHGLGLDAPYDALAGGPAPTHGDTLLLPAYAASWLLAGEPDMSPRTSPAALALAPPEPGPSALGAEEVVEERPTLLGEHPGEDLRAVVEPAVADDVPQTADGTGLGVVGAEHHPRHPGEDGRTGAHRAGLEGDDEGAARQAPLPPARGGRTQRDDLGVPGGVAPRLADVVPAPDGRTAGVEDDRADRDVPGLEGRARLDEGLAHRLVPGQLDAHALVSPTRSSKRSPKPRRRATSERISSG